MYLSDWILISFLALPSCCTCHPSFECRIGRTGRAGRTGAATTLFLSQDEAAAGGVADVMLRSGHGVPQWLVSLAARSGTAGRVAATGDSSFAAPPEEVDKGAGVSGRPLSSCRGKRGVTAAPGRAAETVPPSPSSVTGRPPSVTPAPAATSGRRAPAATSGRRDPAAKGRPLKVCDLASSRHHPFGGYLPSSSSNGSIKASDMLSDMPSSGHMKLHGTPSATPNRRPSLDKAGADLSGASDEVMEAATAALLARWHAVIHGGRQMLPPSPPSPDDPETEDREGAAGPEWMGEDRTETAEGHRSGASGGIGSSADTGTNGGNRARTQGRREVREEGVATSGSRGRGGRGG